MDKLSLKEKKQALAKEFENDTKLKLKEELSDRGYELFWSDETSIEDAKQMLMAVCVNSMFGCISDVVWSFLNDEGIEELEVENTEEYRVLRKKDDQLLEMKFSTEEDARNCIEDAVRHTAYTIDDFSILKVLANG